MWQSLLHNLYEGKTVPTFKGKEAFHIVALFDDGITVSLTSKEKEVPLSKEVMFRVMEKLIVHKDGVRQKMVDPNARLKLGLLLLHPWTEKVERDEDGKSRSYLVLTDEARKRLTVAE
ncbi:hypothetical protein K1I43_08155 [Anoxybacillus sp. ST70]|uniref:hypothetical protein n=1 Tax=Anoxybacillus sp. ST70 TaxID=2864180 RepID=UPI00067FC107|nr:hypothetical protein [Anoxybacillus sp. ST70]MBW9218508.1 hypothetical protein [Anoxybacillus sp. ST70]